MADEPGPKDVRLAAISHAVDQGAVCLVVTGRERRAIRGNKFGIRQRRQARKAVSPPKLRARGTGEEPPELVQLRDGGITLSRTNVREKGDPPREQPAQAGADRSGEGVHA